MNYMPLLEKQAEARDGLLTKLIEILPVDKRFVAAWLTGSFASGTADALSDLDLTVVVTDTAAPSLFDRPWQAAAQTTPERLAVFSQFGQPAIIHENNWNAPEGGTFTCVIYADPIVTVDWILRPLAGAERPNAARLLFDKAGIAVTSEPTADSLEERIARASEQTAFFWMMAAITAKAIARHDAVRVNEYLEMLRRVMSEVERALTGRAYVYERNSRGLLALGPEDQIESLHKLCGQMSSLMPHIARQGGVVPVEPLDIIEKLLVFVQKTP